MSGPVSFRGDQESDGSASQAHAEIDLPSFQEDMTPSLRRRSRRFGYLALMLAMGVAFLVFLIFRWDSPQKTRILFLGDDYQLDLAAPHNGFGWQGLWMIAVALEPAGSTSSPIGRPVRTLKDLDKAIGEKPCDNLIVFVSLHGGLGFNDEKKELPALYLPEGQKEQAQSERTAKQMLFVSPGEGVERSLLETLKPKKTKRRNTLLLLDATQADTDWLYGRFENTFAKQLEKQEKEIKNLSGKLGQFVVISASGPGERSWIDEANGMSFFAEAVLDVLQHHERRSGTLTAQGLFDAIKKKLEDNVNKKYISSQVPVMLPRASDSDSKNPARHIKIYLPSLQKTHIASAPSTPENSVKWPKELSDAWKDYFELNSRDSQAPPWVYTPELWRLYSELMLRADGLSRAGYQFRDPKRGGFKPLLDTIDGVKRKIEDGQLSLRRSPTYSHALSMVAGTDEADRDLAASQQKLLDEVKVGNKFDSFLEDCKRASKARRDLPAELHVPWMYAQFPTQFGAQPRPKELPTRFPAQVVLAKEVRVLAEQVAAGLSPNDSDRGNAYGEQMLPWIIKEVEEADRLRRQGEDLMFAGKDMEQAAHKKLEDAQRLYKATATNVIEPLRQAMLLRDEILAKLPFYVRWGSHSLSGDWRKRCWTAGLAHEIETGCGNSAPPREEVVRKESIGIVFVRPPDQGSPRRCHQETNRPSKRRAPMDQESAAD